MIAVAKYFLLNMVIMGTIILSTVFKLDFLLTIVAWYVGIEALIYVLACGANDVQKRDIFKKARDGFKVYKLPLECLWLSLVFYLGHPVIGTWMFISFGCYCYLTLCKYQLSKEPQE